MSHGGTSGLSSLRTPRVLDDTHDPVGLWWFDGDLTDQAGSEDLSVGLGTLQYTSGHEHGRLAARFRDNQLRLIGSDPASANLRVQGDVTVEIVCMFDTTVGVDSYGTDLFGCANSASLSDAAHNDLYMLYLDNQAGQIVPGFFWEYGSGSFAVCASDTRLALGQWYHIVGVRESEGGGLSTARLYLNGVLIKEVTGLADAVDGSSGRIISGRDLNNSGQGWLGGILSSAKVVNRALTAREVLWEYQYVAGERPFALPIYAGPVLTPVDYGSPTFSGSVEDVTFFTSPSIDYLTNQVPTGPALRAYAASSGFAPTQVTKDGKLAFHCGSGSFLDALESFGGEVLSDFISDDGWHVFTVVNFGAITAPSSEDPGHQHLLFGGFALTPSGGHFALTLHEDMGAHYAQGFANNGAFDLIARDALSENAYHLVEFWNTGTVMGIRVDDAAEMTTAWTGKVPAGSPGMGNIVRVGSVNYQGGWDSDTNVMSELHVYDGALSDDDRAAVRAILAAKGYGFSV